MKRKLILLGAIITLSLGTTATVVAQRHQNPKFRSTVKSFKRSDKFSIMGGVGLAAMNSDSRTSGFSNEGLSVIKRNGFGPELSVGAIYQVAPYVAFQGNLDFVNFTSKGSNEPGGDVSIQSHAVEASGSVVVNLIDNFVRGRGPYGSRGKRLVVPYVKAGFGVLSYKASSSSVNNSKEFAPVTDYPAVATVIPVGAGFRINYSNRISFVPELNMHFVSTDYLDNKVEKGGITGDNDNYLSASINVMYTLPSKKKFSFRRR